MSAIINLRIPVQTEIVAKLEIETDLTQFNPGVAETIKARMQALAAPILMDEESAEPLVMSDPKKEPRGRLHMLDGGQVAVVSKPKPAPAAAEPIEEPEEEQEDESNPESELEPKSAAEFAVDEPELPDTTVVWRERACHDVTAVIIGRSGTKGLDFKRLTCPATPHLVGGIAKDFISHFLDAWEPTDQVFESAAEEQPAKRKRRTKAEMEEARRAEAGEAAETENSQEPVSAVEAAVLAESDEAESESDSASELITESPSPSAAPAPIGPLSSIVRVGDHFEKLPDQRVRGKVYDAIKVLEVDHTGQRVRTQSGYTTFGALDQFYQLADGMPRGPIEASQEAPQANLPQEMKGGPPAKESTTSPGDINPEPVANVAPDPTPAQSAAFARNNLMETLVPGDVIRLRTDGAKLDGYPEEATVERIDDSGCVWASGDATGTMSRGILNEYEMVPAEPAPQSNGVDLDALNAMFLAAPVAAEAGGDQ